MVNARFTDRGRCFDMIDRTGIRRSANEIMCIVIVFCFMFYGCATMQDAKEGKGAMTSYAYQNTFDETWRATGEALDAITQSCTSGRRFVTIEQNREGRYFLAESRLGLTIVPGVAIPLHTPGVGPGHNIYILITPIGDKLTKVEVTVNRKTSVTPNTDWGARIRDEIKLKPIN